ncbi:MAG: U32 family peptidase [Coriobacteriales bacterium]
MRTKPELLAPAGGWEQLEYAIRFGADAVYLACDKFGMRARACNFSLGEMPAVVEYCHSRGVSVHVTCNIVMHEHQLPELERYMAALAQASVDAFILGDLGALAVARRVAPQVAVHVSTQASVSNTQAALMWHQLGASRIVCARELSLADIAAMRRALPPELELEAFVHGAMCMAYSGRCLISDYTTGRSALEGHCAQSCRWNYALVEEKRPGEYYAIEQDEHGSYLLNAQDMNMLAHVHELAEAGVDSLKIEGRNKKAYYVATVVNAYRQVLDGADPTQFARELETVSHRPYSTGFYFGPAHQTHGCIDYIREWEWAAEVLSCADEPGDDGRYTCTLRCRNRFEPGAALELLSPHQPVRPLQLSSLAFLPTDPAVPAQPAELANRTNEDYRALSTLPLHPHDIIRVKR